MFQLKLALRNLRKTPFVTLVAALSLALGIGANTAIFSLFDQLLMRPLPVPEPNELVNLATPGPKSGSTSCNNAGDCDEIFSYPMFLDLEREQRSFAGLAAHRLFGANFAADGQTSTTDGVLVSGSYFSTLGLTPALGRLIDTGDDEVAGESPVVVLSHGAWRNRFGEDPDVVGRAVVVNGHTLTVIGVAPEGFTGTTLGNQPEVFVPITMRGLMSPGFDGFENRLNYWAYVFGRLKPGVTLEQALTDLNVTYRRILQEVEAPLQDGASESYMERFRAKQLMMEPGALGQSSTHEEARAPMLLLFAVAGVVLLIACANIANLLLARSAARAGEMAVRLSVGASRSRLIAQLLTEACLLAVLGGLAGIAVARWTLVLIASILPPEAATTLDLQLNLTILGFAAALALGTGLLFGLFPALHSTRLDLTSSLKGQAGQPSGSRSAARFRTGLVMAQIALSTALLVGAGLFTKSLVNVSRVDLGIEVDHLVTFGISPELNGYTSDQSRDLFIRVEEELASMPGVEGVTASMVPLIAGSNWGTNVKVEGFEAEPDTDTNSRFSEVGPGYFRTVGISLISGREFTDADILDRPKVAVVNEVFAKKFDLGREAVGRRMAIGGGDADLDIEIVGLVENAKYSDVKQEIPPLFYLPYRQDETLGFMNFYVRTALDPEQILPSIPKVMARLDPNLPVEELKTMPQQVEENIFLDRFLTTLAAAFALLATVLAAVGLYGVLAYTVTQRTREIGLRMALGADGSRVRRLVLKQVGKLTIVGGVVGLLAAVAIGRVATGMLYDMDGNDPVVFLVSAALLALVALGAGLAPAVKASRVDPMLALRYD